MAELTPLPGLKELRIEGQKTLPTGAVSPFAGTDDQTTPDRTLADWVSLAKDWSASGALQSVLDRHGAILLRGLPISSPDAFSQLLHAFGWSPHQDVGNPVKRNVLAPNVAKANEGPPSLYIAAHSEFGISTIFPSHICFWGNVIPEAGGETPLNSGAWLMNRLIAEAPEFVRALQERGVTYTIYHPPTAVSGDANGNGVLMAWGSKVEVGDDAATIKRKVEEEIQRISPETTWEWQPDGGLYTMQRVPAFRLHPNSNLPVVFGNLTSYYIGAQMRGTLNAPYLDPTGFYKPPPLYGDGSPIPLKYLDLLLSIIEDIRTMIKWEKYDVVIIDNISTQHSRLPWTAGNRQILASLWDSGLQKAAVPVKVF